MELFGPLIGIIIMFGLFGYTLDVRITEATKELKRIADAIENKNQNDKKVYLRFEQATEKLEILTKDPLLPIKHPGL